ncbi:MAG: sulfotransferase [Bacteroidetes bacterium]|jgi:hypothetical protein|nr:sulfotransferase [Bacteroidota bacterium]
MSSQIIEAEQKLADLLPEKRLEGSPTAALIAAAKLWSETVWEYALSVGPMPLTNDQLIQGKLLAKNPIYICGVHRSGTTLVKDILEGHPDLVVLPSEGTWYTNLEYKLSLLPKDAWIVFLAKEWLRRLANPINQPPYWLAGRSAVDSSPYVDFARYLMAWWGHVKRDNDQWPHIALVLAWASCTNKLSARYWVDKTPVNERYLARIRDSVPHAKIIHVVRHPLATLTSRKKMEPSVSFRHALADLKVSFSVAAKQSALNYSHYMQVHYEELCEEPELITTEIASFLGIPMSAALNQPTVAGIPVQANSSFIKEPVAGEVIKTTEHQQQDLLSVAEKDLIAAYIGSLSAKLKYPLHRVGFIRGLYLRIRYRLLR